MNIKKIYIKEKLIEILLLISALISIITTFAIITSLILESIPFFKEISFFSLVKFGEIWDPSNGDYSIYPILIGTLMIVLNSCIFAIPLGLGSAIYLSEYANDKTRSFLKPILEILAGIPSVVYGFFAFLYITPILKNNISWLAKIFLILTLFLSIILSISTIKRFFNKTKRIQKIFYISLFLMFFSMSIYLILNFIYLYKQTNILEVETYNVLSASIVVGIMITPLVASLSEDALKSVPHSLREAGLGLGMTKIETIIGIIIPGAISGIVSSFILAISRAIGETMVVSMAAGSRPILNFNPLGQIQTMTGYMVSKSFGEVVVGSLEYQTIFVVGLILFIMTLLLNIFAKKIVNILREV